MRKNQKERFAEGNRPQAILCGFSLSHREILTGAQTTNERL
jgi:hypothetical protein